MEDRAQAQLTNKEGVLYVKPIPNSPNPTTLTSLIRVRVTPELEELVRQAASKEHQDYAGWVRGILSREVKRVLEEKSNGQ